LVVNLSCSDSFCRLTDGPRPFGDQLGGRPRGSRWQRPIGTAKVKEPNDRIVSTQAKRKLDVRIIRRRAGLPHGAETCGMGGKEKVLRGGV
jgi:hypothetical protein